MINQCSSCGGFCKRSGCERENVKHTPKRTWVELTDEEITAIWQTDECYQKPQNFARAILRKAQEK